MDIKTIDFQSPNAGSELAKSIRETGFAIFKNHPIPADLITATIEDWKSFFGRPENEKLPYAPGPNSQAGYFAFQKEIAKGGSHPNLQEHYHYYMQRPLPDKMSNATRDLFSLAINVGHQIVDWLEAETPDDIRNNLSQPLSKMIENSKYTLLRCIHYPPLKGDEAPDALRAAEHEDIDIISCLFGATAEGLQVLGNDNKWHSVRCGADELVINAGDMLQMATNHYYKSTTHRVVKPTGESAKKPRYSIPVFIHAREDVILKDGITAHDYLKQRLVENGILSEGEDLHAA